MAGFQTRDTGDKFVMRVVQIEANLLETRGREYNAGAAGYEVCREFAVLALARAYSVSAKSGRRCRGRQPPAIRTMT
jgi:hypothetical protein